jgi:hypothetical protein
VAFVFDGQSLTIYVNGKRLTTVKVPSRKATASVIGIGGYQGLIDEIRVWDGVRSAAEIKTDMSTAI